MDIGGLGVRPTHTIATTFQLPAQDLDHITRHVHCWHKLRGKRTFLTGASGFVGTWLVESFAWVNQRLALDAELTPISRASFPLGRFDYGIHAAKADGLEADVAFTRRTLDFASQRGVSRLLFTSSGAAGVSQSAYAQAKYAGECLCAQYSAQSNFCAVIARLFTFLGPALPLDRNFAVGNFVRDVISGGPILVQGDGIAQRSYLYAADLAIWLWTLLLEGESAQPYNVGAPDPISIAALAQAVAANTIPETRIVTAGSEVPGVASVYLPDVERARTELHLQPLIPLDEGIRRMFAWNLAKYREIDPSKATIT